MLVIPIKSITSESTQTWSVTVYDSGLNALVELSPNGNTISYLPDVDHEPRPFENYSFWYTDFSQVASTDDGHYLISIIQQEDPYEQYAIITDVTTGQTRIIPKPPLEDTEFFVSYRFGAFNPEMTEVALPYVSHDTTTGFGCCANGGIVIANLETGTISHLLDADKTFNFNKSTAFVDNWTIDGIWFSPTCSACTPIYHYFYQIWNPNTGTISQTDVFHHRHNLERLPTSGEILYSENNPNFPLGGPCFPPRLNVVSLYKANEVPPNTSGKIVYYDYENLDFNKKAHWVNGGRAFLVSKALHNVVVFRDGHQITIDYENQQYFLAMTDDGWLTFNRSNNQIQHFVVLADKVLSQTIYEGYGDIEVSNIQLSPNKSELSEFTYDITPPDVQFCPGALPTRLKIGDWAEVIADQEEIAIARLVVGDVEFDDMSYENLEILPLGAYIQVIEAFKCSHDWGYVKVNYQGRIGWILEIYQMSYHIAPVSTENE